jgi:hypothetical protein
MLKQPKYQSRAYRDWAKGQPCVRCLHHGCYSTDTTVPAHYHGPRKEAYGGGGSSKASDLVSAHLCMECHALFDSDDLRAGGWESKWERSEELLHWCVMTLIRAKAENKL